MSDTELAVTSHLYYSVFQQELSKNYWLCFRKYKNILCLNNYSSWWTQSLIIYMLHRSGEKQLKSICMYMLELAWIVVFSIISIKKEIACIIYNHCIYTRMSVLVQVLHQTESIFFFTCNCCLLQSLTEFLIAFSWRQSFSLYGGSL